MDRIEIRGLRAFGHHGVFEDERLRGQTFVVDVVLELDLETAGASDSLGDTVDYGTLAQQLAEAVEHTRFNLLETLAGHLAQLAVSDPAVHAAEVRVAKPEAPLSVALDEVAVVVRRERPEGRGVSGGPSPLAAPGAGPSTPASRGRP
jgi:7,8-dihydroneopterin aldolase/epimerase/oxygenase